VKERKRKGKFYGELLLKRKKLTEKLGTVWGKIKNTNQR